MAPLKSRASPAEGPAGRPCAHYVLARHKASSVRSLTAVSAALPTGQLLHVAADARLASVPLASLPRQLKAAIARRFVDPPCGATVTLVSPVVVVGRRRTPAARREGAGEVAGARSSSAGGLVGAETSGRRCLQSSATSVLAWLKASRQPAALPSGEGGAAPPLPCGALAGCAAGRLGAAPVAAVLGSYGIKAVASSAWVASAGAAAADDDVRIPVAVTRGCVDDDDPRSPPSPRPGGAAFSAGDVAAAASREVAARRVPNPGSSPAESFKGLGTLVVSDSWACVMLIKMRDTAGEAAGNGWCAMADVSPDVSPDVASDVSPDVALGDDDSTAPGTTAAARRLGAIDVGAAGLGDSAGVADWHRPGNSASGLAYGVRGSAEGSRDLPADEAAPETGVNSAGRAVGEEAPCGQQMSFVSPDRLLRTDYKVPGVIKNLQKGIVLVPPKELRAPSASDRALLARVGITKEVRVYLVPVLLGRSESRASPDPHVATTAGLPYLARHRSRHPPQPQAVPSRRRRRKRRSPPPPAVDAVLPGTSPRPHPHRRSHGAGDSAGQETRELGGGGGGGGSSPSDTADDVVFYGDNGACNGMDWMNELPGEGWGVGWSGDEAGAAPQPPSIATVPSPPSHRRDDTEQRDRLAWLRITLREQQEAVEEALALSRCH